MSNPTWKKPTPYNQARAILKKLLIDGQILRLTPTEAQTAYRQLYYTLHLNHKVNIDKEVFEILRARSNGRHSNSEFVLMSVHARPDLYEWKLNDQILGFMARLRKQPLNVTLNYSSPPSEDNDMMDIEPYTVYMPNENGKGYEVVEMDADIVELFPNAQ